MSKCVFAGSFDPITNGHLEVIKKATTLYKEVVVGILINWDKKYNFCEQDRVQMVKDACKDIQGVQVKFFSGTLVEFLKQENTNVFVRGIRNQGDVNYENLTKEYNSKFMPEIEYVYICTTEYQTISSTKINQMIANKEDISSFVPKCVLKYI